MFNISQDMIKSTNWVLPIATAIGALGMGLSLKNSSGDNLEISSNILFQIITMVILVWQGGSGQNLEIAAITGVVFVLLIHVFNYMMYKNTQKSLSNFIKYLSVGGDKQKYLKKLSE